MYTPPYCGGVDAETSSEKEQHKSMGPRGAPPPPPQGGQNLPVLFPKKYVAALVPGRGVPGWDFKLDQTPGSPFTPPCAGSNYDLGRG